MNEARLYILCGLPFAGKTTLALALVNRFCLMHIDIDQINTDFGVGLYGASISPEEWERTYTEAYKQLEVALDSKHSVIFEGANFTKELRDRIRAISNVRGVISRVIFVDVPVSEAQRRLLNNRIIQQRYDVRDDNFAYAVAYFESPTKDEGVIYFDQSEPLEEWILQNFNTTNL